jgi:hypothetical protein
MVLLLAGGRQRGQYHISMSVDGDTLTRELRYTKPHKENESPPPIEVEEARHLAQVYGVDVPVASSEIVVSGSFTGATPTDIGGAGSLQYLRSPLGEAWIYIERFRGTDQPRASLVDREAAADELADIVRDWFRIELKGIADAERVVTFLDTDYRTDLRELVTFVWLAEAMNDVSESDPARDHEMLMRIGTYFVERGYVDITKLPELVKLSWNDTDEEFRLIVNRALARRLDLDLSRDEWAFLKTRGTVEQSLDAALRDDPRLRDYVRRVSPNGPETGVPASAWVGDVSMRAFGMSLQGGDALSVRLKLEDAPFQTNGEWNPAEKCAMWNRGLPLREAKSSHPLPAFLYAEWSTPNAAFQQAHFGKTVLAGQTLLEYCTWSSGLADDQRQAWDEFVATLKPGPGLAAKIQGFVFPPSRGTPPVTVTAPNILIEALTRE